MVADRDSVLEKVASYYSEKLAEHGQSARGVDWNGEESQMLRFEQLSKIISAHAAFSINDLGCGFGSYFSYLNSKFVDISYNGFDLSADMIAAARQRYAGNEKLSFIVSGEPLASADYGVASGIFNVRLDSTDDVWRAHINSTLDALHATSRKGFAFNCLTSYSDKEKRKDYLYYADPGELFDYCKRHFSRNIALLHDYGLYEFTILVRK